MEILIDYKHGEALLAPLPLTELAKFVLAWEEKPAASEVSIVFVDDDEMTLLNGQYRGLEGPTDVLSFECDSLDDAMAPDPGSALPEDAIYELGDIIIAPDVAMRQTAEFGTTFREEIELLLVHGLLHLCGYDHIEDDEAVIMEAREAEILKAWADAEAR